ncbi:MAG: flagellar biosynthetic protein FliR [Planctomycetes bacterium]|nr:flagellar biosynthetic protein FliR [Planctomycetota bacterium]
MDSWFPIILPFVLLLARITAFFAVLPVFGWTPLPVFVRAGIAVLIAVFFYLNIPAAGPEVYGLSWLGGIIAVIQEIIIGIGLGLTANFLYMAVQMCGHVAAQQMGMADAGVINPATGEEGETMALFMEMSFLVCFLVAGGHQLLIWLLASSYKAFPLASPPDVGALAQVLLAAGSAMFIFAIKLSAPVLAAFVVIIVAMAILARILPEMNILFESFPIRVGIGFLMAAAMLPLLQTYTGEMSLWLQGIIAS